MLLTVGISSYGCTWEVWWALKKLELLSAAPWAPLTHLSCSPNFLRASIIRYTHAKHQQILTFLIQMLLTFGGRYNRFFWDTRLTILKLLNFNILFQLVLTKFVRSELFSCLPGNFPLPKVEHVIKSRKEPIQTFLSPVAPKGYGTVESAESSTMPRGVQRRNNDKLWNSWIDAMTTSVTWWQRKPLKIRRS